MKLGTKSIYNGKNYPLALKSDPDPYIRAMQRLHEFSENVYGNDRDEMEAYLKSCNAFLEHTEGKLKIEPR